MSTAPQNWIERTLRRFPDTGLCGCGKCRVTLRKEVLRGLSLAERRSRKVLDGDGAIAIAHVLAKVNPEKPDDMEFEHVVRLVLMDLWQVVLGSHQAVEMRSILARTWAEGVWTDAEDHYQSVTERRREHEEASSPEAVHKRREEKKRLKQQKHGERLERKKGRDKRWWEPQMRLWTND